MIAMTTQRGNASTRVRLNSRAIIFGVQEKDFETRAQEFKELIGWTSNGDGTYDYKVMAPILFEDYEGKVDRWKIFRNPIILRVCDVLLCHFITY